MRLGQKIRNLRAVEGSLRGLERPMTQPEVVRAMKREVQKGISQAYLSQIESGARPHLTNATRELLARFFKVYPGFLVDDPEGFHIALTSHVRTPEVKLDSWLLSGAEHFRTDGELRRMLLTLAEYQDSRKALLLLEAILKSPELVDRLVEVLRPVRKEAGEWAKPALP